MALFIRKPHGPIFDVAIRGIERALDGLDEFRLVKGLRDRHCVRPPRQNLFNITADEQMGDEANAKDLIHSRDAISFP